MKNRFLGLFLALTFSFFASAQSDLQTKAEQKITVLGLAHTKLEGALQTLDEQKRSGNITLLLRAIQPAKDALQSVKTSQIDLAKLRDQVKSGPQEVTTVLRDAVDESVKVSTEAEIQIEKARQAFLAALSATASAK